MAPVRTIAARPLDEAGFAPFGRVVDLEDLPGRPVNEGRGTRHDVPVELHHRTYATGPTTAIYRIGPSAFPIRVTLLERHELSDQSFLPLARSGYLVAVAPSDPNGRPDPDRLVAFIGRPGQAIVYAAGTWHLPLVALGVAGPFLMQIWETGTAQDCEVEALEAPILVTVGP